MARVQPRATGRPVALVSVADSKWRATGGAPHLDWRPSGLIWRKDSTQGALVCSTLVEPPRRDARLGLANSRKRAGIIIVTRHVWVRAGLFIGAIASTGCGSDSGSDGGGGAGGSDPSCLAGSIELTETKRTDSPSFNTVLLDFDAENTSGTDYDISKGSRAISLDFVVTTAEGTKYESEAPLTAAKIGAGATAAVVAMAEYGA